MLLDVSIALHEAASTTLHEAASGHPTHLTPRCFAFTK